MEIVYETQLIKQIQRVYFECICEVGAQQKQRGSKRHKPVLKNILCEARTLLFSEKNPNP